jgi:pimeloyl-ACP methyl ester carboxylesterase
MAAFAALEAAARARLRLAGVGSRSVATRHGTVHLFDGPGQGPLGPVICVHGLASSAASFARTLLGLQPHFDRVLALDLPGHGRSAVPAGSLRTRALLESLDDALLQATERPALLLGNSLGGGLVLRFALDHPERVRGVVLSSPAGAALQSEEIERLLRAFHLHKVRDGRELFARLYHRPLPLDALFAWDLLRTVRRPHLGELIRDLPDAPSFSRDELGSLAPPALLLWGESDRLMPTSARDYFRAHLPPALQFEALPEVGHSPHLEAPARYVRAVLEFARRIAPG